MTTQSPDMKKLREVAEKATPGPWHIRYCDDEMHMCMTAISAVPVPDCNVDQYTDRSPDDMVAIVYHQCQPLVRPEDCAGSDENAEFIATFNPQTILALLDELAALRKENEGLRALAEKVIDDYSYYERYGATCTFEGAPMIYASVLEELMDAARAAIGDSHE